MNNLKTAYIVINDEYIDAVCDNEVDAAEMCLSLIEEEMYRGWFLKNHSLSRSEKYISPSEFKADYPYNTWCEYVGVIQAPLLLTETI